MVTGVLTRLKGVRIPPPLPKLMKFDPKDYAHEVVKSSCRFTRLENPQYRAMMILRHVRRHLRNEMWQRTPEPHITDAILCVDLCISRVNSDLRA